MERVGVPSTGEGVSYFEKSTKFPLESLMVYSIYRDIKLIFQTLLVLLKKDSTEGFKERKNIYVVEDTPEEFLIEE